MLLSFLEEMKSHDTCSDRNSLLAVETEMTEFLASSGSKLRYSSSLESSFWSSFLISPRSLNNTFWWIIISSTLIFHSCREALTPFSGIFDTAATWHKDIRFSEVFVLKLVAEAIETNSNSYLLFLTIYMLPV